VIRDDQADARQGDSVRRKLGDRRIGPRFDIVGDLWGTLESVLHLPVRNVGRGGALIHSQVPLSSGSVHRLTLETAGAALTAQVRVQRVEARSSRDGERTYLIGLEFMSPHPALLEQVDRWVAAAHGEAAVAEA
jgi:hypothetical protein